MFCSDCGGKNKLLFVELEFFSKNGAVLSYHCYCSRNGVYRCVCLFNKHFIEHLSSIINI